MGIRSLLSKAECISSHGQELLSGRAQTAVLGLTAIETACRSLSASTLLGDYVMHSIVWILLGCFQMKGSN